MQKDRTDDVEVCPSLGTNSLCREPSSTAGVPLPDVVIDATGEGFSLLVSKERTEQALPEVIQNKHFDLSLYTSVLGPIVHRRQQCTQRCEERLAGLLEPVAVSLADVVLEEHLKENVSVFAQPLFCCPPLLSIEAVCQ